jgi:chaperone modulatory protein CbpM
MKSEIPGLWSGEIFEERTELGVDELCRLCSVDRTTIVQFVEEGVLSVAETDPTGWRFQGGALRRARVAVRLQKDLELNLPGVALALELLEELDRLRSQLGVLRR